VSLRILNQMGRTRLTKVGPEVTRHPQSEKMSSSIAVQYRTIFVYCKKYLRLRVLSSLTSPVRYNTGTGDHDVAGCSSACLRVAIDRVLPPIAGHCPFFLIYVVLAQCASALLAFAFVDVTAVSWAMGTSVITIDVGRLEEENSHSFFFRRG
jgi:hypothetical protein